MEMLLQAEIKSDEPLLIWGTGQLAMKLLAKTSLGSANIVAFVDNNPIHRGERILGKPELTPGEIREMPNPILISSTLHAAAISRQIVNEMGMRNRLILLNDVKTPEPIG